MLKTEEIYMEQNNKRMPEATDPLYFVIDEKQNSVDLTDKGIDLITGNAAAGVTVGKNPFNLSNT